MKKTLLILFLFLVASRAYVTENYRTGGNGSRSDVSRPATLEAHGAALLSSLEFCAR